VAPNGSSGSSGLGAQMVIRVVSELTGAMDHQDQVEVSGFQNQQEHQVWCKWIFWVIRIANGANGSSRSSGAKWC
jgi:hypothetical protein